MVTTTETKTQTLYPFCVVTQDGNECVVQGAEAKDLPGLLVGPCWLENRITDTRADILPVKSSNVRLLGYDPNAKIMYVVFTNGGVYMYRDVEAEVCAEVSQAESVGRELNKRVKGRYCTVRLAGEDKVSKAEDKVYDELKAIEDPKLRRQVAVDSVPKITNEDPDLEVHDLSCMLVHARPDPEKAAEQAVTTIRELLKRYTAA